MATYKYDEKTGELVCVDSRNGKLRSSVWMPKDTIHSGHRFENLGDKIITSKEHKRQVMKEMGVAEAG